MKHSLPIFLAACLALPATAEFETWTNKAGESASLELVEVTEVNGEKVGKFMLKNGKWSKISQSQLIEADAKRLENWTPRPSGAPSVFDDFLWGKLVHLEGGELKPMALKRKPAKYYVFYYTASWCGPCQRYTPSLVEWYEKNKNDNFEIFLISSDRDQKAMEGYTKSKKMPWPHLAFEHVKAFKGEFRETHAVRGIPSLIVCDPDGKVLGNYRSQLPQLTGMVK